MVFTILTRVREVRLVMNNGEDRYHGFWFNKRKIYQTSAVFAISGTPEYTFVERKNISEEIKKYLGHQDSVLLFLGYSKSGKTVFRKKYFENSHFNIVMFRPKRSGSVLQDLYDQMASELQLTITSESVAGNTGETTKSFEGGFLNKSIGKLIGKLESKVGHSLATTEQLAVQPKVDINFLCSKLSNKNILVIIEDYHLLDDEFNEEISTDFKHFLDEEIFFLILGVPSCADRTLKSNPDLSGRVRRIIFDYLEESEAREIVAKGCELLNVELSERVIDKVIKNSYCNAYLVQHICRQLLELNSVGETVKKTAVIDEDSLVDEACNHIANNSLHNDYNGIRDKIQRGLRPQHDNTINQYDEILKSIGYFDLKKLETGIYAGDVSDMTLNRLISDGQNDTPELRRKVRESIRQAFSRINEVVNQSVTKPILYLQDEKLYLNDLLFKFYLEWVDKDKIEWTFPYMAQKEKAREQEQFAIV